MAFMRWWMKAGVWDYRSASAWRAVGWHTGPSVNA